MEKLDASEIYPRRLNAKEVLMTQRDGEFIFPVAEFQETHSEAGIHHQERESQRRKSHGDREEFQPEETKDEESIRIFGPTQKLGKTFIDLHHFEPRSSTNVPREESFLIYKICIIERSSSEKKYKMHGGSLEKSQHI